MSSVEQQFCDFHEGVGILADKASWVLQQIRTSDNTGFDILEELLERLEELVLATPTPVVKRD